MRRRSARRGMVLPLLLLVLLFGSILAGLLLKEAQSAADLSSLQAGQALVENEGISAVNRGEGWILEQMESKGALPRWLDGKPSENGLLEQGEWGLEGRGTLLVHEEVFHEGPLACSLKIYDLDYRLAGPLLGDSSLPPSYFELFCLSGGAEMADPRAIGRLAGRGDVSLPGGMSLDTAGGALQFSGNGEGVLLFEEDAEGSSLSGENGEVRIRFRLSGGSETLPGGLDLGFRMAAGDPSSAFASGFSASFCVEDEGCPENRDRFLLKRNTGGSGEGEVLARIPFPFCRSENPFDQERYLAYLSRIHELRVRFEPEGITATFDPGHGTLEKTLSVRLESSSPPGLGASCTGLRVRSRAGGSLSVFSLRVHPADEKGYFPECRQRGYYLIKADVTGPALHKSFETIVSADLVSGRLLRLAWTVLPFF